MFGQVRFRVSQVRTYQAGMKKAGGNFVLNDFSEAQKNGKPKEDRVLKISLLWCFKSRRRLFLCKNRIRINSYASFFENIFCRVALKTTGSPQMLDIDKNHPIRMTFLIQVRIDRDVLLET